MALSLEELEQLLRSISHSEEAIQADQAFSNGLAGTKARLEVWNAANAIVRKPIEHGVTAPLGFDTPDDQFTVLQGDIVQTESAFFYGERIAGMPKFAVLNSSCDCPASARNGESVRPLR